MADAIIAKFSQKTFEVEFTPGVWSRPCGLTSRSISRKQNHDTTEVPDCADDDKPMSVRRSVRSVEHSLTGKGVWASQSHEQFQDWFASGLPLNVRVHHVNAASGDTEYETGPAFLSMLDESADRGKSVEASIQIDFDGTPVRTAKP